MYICAKLFDDFRKGFHISASPSNPIACTWRHIQQSKVKAHRNLEQVSDGSEDMHYFLGNQSRRDSKFWGAGKHEVIDSDLADLKKATHEITDLAVYMAGILSAWPKPLQLTRVRSTQSMAFALAAKTKHVFQWVNGWWMCMICLRRSRRYSVFLTESPCAPSSRLDAKSTRYGTLLAG